VTIREERSEEGKKMLLAHKNFVGEAERADSHRVCQREKSPSKVSCWPVSRVSPEVLTQQKKKRSRKRKRNEGGKPADAKRKGSASTCTRATMEAGSLGEILEKVPEKMMEKKRRGLRTEEREGSGTFWRTIQRTKAPVAETLEGPRKSGVL